MLDGRSQSAWLISSNGADMARRKLEDHGVAWGPHARRHYFRSQV